MRPRRATSSIRSVESATAQRVLPLAAAFVHPKRPLGPGASLWRIMPPTGKSRHMANEG
jgi:hypothetical protein